MEEVLNTEEKLAQLEDLVYEHAADILDCCYGHVPAFRRSPERIMASIKRSAELLLDERQKTLDGERILLCCRGVGCPTCDEEIRKRVDERRAAKQKAQPGAKPEKHD